MTAEADEAWMVWLTSAELARLNHADAFTRSLCDLKALHDFEAWIDALMATEP